MKKSRSVAVVTVATIGLAIGCASNDENAVCVDSRDRVVAREACDTNRGGRFFWYHHSAYARSYPAIGSRVAAGGTFEPARTKVARGGFGTTARGRTVVS